jgi:opacity protein-like surface antigen
MRIRCGIVLAVLGVVCTAAPAQAQWVVSPYLGINLGGDAEFRRGGPGGSAGYFGGRLGFEFDVQRYHHFFKDKNVELVPDNCAPGLVAIPCSDLNTDAWSFMGNVVVPVRSKGATWRPYGTAGFGVIHAWIEGPGDQYDVGQNNPAFNVGGGVLYSLNNRVGLRSDLRYVRAFVDESKTRGRLLQGLWLCARDLRGHSPVPRSLNRCERSVTWEHWHDMVMTPEPIS